MIVGSDGREGGEEEERGEEDEGLEEGDRRGGIELGVFHGSNFGEKKTRAFFRSENERKLAKIGSGQEKI